MKNDQTSVTCIDKNYRKLAFVVATLLVISAIIYLVMQFKLTGKISDILFVSLTLFESLFILFAGSMMIQYIKNKGMNLYTSFDYFKEPVNPEIEINKLVCIFQHYNKFWIFVLIWAICMGALPYFQNYWVNYSSLNIFFGIFLFFTNVITSYFVILLILLFVRIRKLWILIKVELWNRENPAAKFIFSISKRVAIIGSIYMTSSLTAWNTSEKITPFGNEILIFFAFSVALLLASIIIPLLPFINTIINLKNNALCDIDYKIQKEYSVLLDNFNKDGRKVEFIKMNELVEMRKKIESIQTFPFQLRTISAAISIIIISLIPKILELILTNLFK
jgi:hypothetical protein